MECTAVECRKEGNGAPLPRNTGKESEGNTGVSGTCSGCPFFKKILPASKFKYHVRMHFKTFFKAE